MFSNRQVLLRVHPPEGSRKASLKEIQQELRRLKVTYRHETLFEIYRQAANEYELLATHESKDYEVMVDVSPDALNAWIKVIPPDRGSGRLTPEKIKEALEHSSIEKGILYDQIKRILDSGEARERVLIAQGAPNQHGVNGKIEFTEKATERFAMGDNTADYRELNLIDNVVEGERIAVITHPTPGVNGFNVHAKILKGRPGKRAKIKLGRNVHLNEEGTELTAVTAGYVVRSGSKISVENVLEVNNVDGETGNLRFHGVIRVRGQVEDGFELNAEKGIEVAGTVGKAKLFSRGDILIGKGALGADLECQGNLQAKFFTDVRTKVGGNVLVDDYILHSEVEARRAVKVAVDPNGFILGGRVKAGSEIWAPIMGSEVSEEHTALEVGGGVNVRKRFDALDARMEHNLEVYDKLRKNLQYLQRKREKEGAPEDGRQKELYETLLNSGRKLTRELLEQSRLHHELLQELAHPEEDIGMVIASQAVHPGVTVQIQTSRVSIRDPMEACGFSLLGGHLKAMPFGAALKLHKQQRNRILSMVEQEKIVRSIAQEKEQASES